MLVPVPMILMIYIFILYILYIHAQLYKIKVNINEQLHFISLQALFKCGLTYLNTGWRLYYLAKFGQSASRS